MSELRWRVPVSGGLGLAMLLLSPACGRHGPPEVLAGSATPVYSQVTGRLEALQSDTNGDGRIDTLAHMDGVTLKYIEVDRDFDGRFDRWEYYISAPGTPGAFTRVAGKTGGCRGSPRPAGWCGSGV